MWTIFAMRTGWISRGYLPQSPLDPLQRRAELIAHYERHGYPERAAYLRRVDEGQGIMAGLQAAAEDATSINQAIHAAIVWWAGQDVGGLGSTEAMRSGGDLVHAGFRLEEALLHGLAARINTRLQPFPRQLCLSPDYEVYSILRAWHEAVNGVGPLPRWNLSPPHHDGIRSAHVVVCELCSVVGLATKPWSRCRLCAKRHALPGAFLAPITSPDLPWLITGYRQKYLRTCRVCHKPFFGKVDAVSCSTRCRTAKHRAA